MQFWPVYGRTIERPNTTYRPKTPSHQTTTCLVPFGKSHVGPTHHPYPATVPIYSPILSVITKPPL